jgi:hypothetical protein
MNGSRSRLGRVWVAHRWVIVTMSEVLEIHVEVFWVMTPCSLVGGSYVDLLASSCAAVHPRFRVCGSHWPAWALSFPSVPWFGHFCTVWYTSFILQNNWNFPKLTHFCPEDEGSMFIWNVGPPHQLSTQCHNPTNHVLYCLCTSSGCFVGGKPIENSNGKYPASETSLFWCGQLNFWGESTRTFQCRGCGLGGLCRYRLIFKKWVTFTWWILWENMGGSNMVAVLVCSDDHDVGTWLRFQLRHTGAVICLLNSQLQGRKFQIRNVSFRDDIHLNYMLLFIAMLYRALSILG